ncbi:MAG: hypothetical protein M1834_005315 [Cirrosporium novae-zelandiae]|nr:MAG: hypothetical protein M1834_005315 [Cirrosporium novae-zelandiae]
MTTTAIKATVATALLTTTTGAAPTPTPAAEPSPPDPTWISPLQVPNPDVSCYHNASATTFPCPYTKTPDLLSIRVSNSTVTINHDGTQIKCHDNGKKKKKFRCPYLELASGYEIFVLYDDVLVQGKMVQEEQKERKVLHKRERVGQAAPGMPNKWDLGMLFHCVIL